MLVLSILIAKVFDMDVKKLEDVRKKFYNKIDQDCSLGSQELKDEIIGSCSGCYKNREIIQCSPKRRKVTNDREKAQNHVTINNQENDQNHHIMTRDDLLSCESCTPSYRRLPQNFYGSNKNDTSNIAKQVLNDTWAVVSPPMLSTKDKKISPYDKVLNKYEDHRYELDMFLERVKLAAEKVSVLLVKIEEGSQPNLETPIRIEDFLDKKNLRCIEEIYGEYGLDIIDVLRLNLTKALLLILHRLEQKKEECKQRLASLKIVPN